MKRSGNALPRKLDTTIAFKAIGLHAELSATDKRVGAALLDHFNHKTGQCDPGLERIARLLGVHTRTVIRSVHRLERAGLFRKDRHGGNLNRNSYEPVWSRFRQIDAAWSIRFREKQTQGVSGSLSPGPCQPCHVGGDNPATETSERNLSKETCQKRQPKIEQGGTERCPRSRSPSGDPALTSAERRWTTDLHQQFSSKPVTYGEIIRLIDPIMQAAATDAEMRVRGAGLQYVVTKLKLRGTR